MDAIPRKQSVKHTYPSLPPPLPPFFRHLHSPALRALAGSDDLGGGGPASSTSLLGRLLDMALSLKEVREGGREGGGEGEGHERGGLPLLFLSWGACSIWC